MEYEINASKYFKDQFENLDEKSRRILSDKIRLIKQNPYRYKGVHSMLFSKVFSVRFSIARKETRMIYVVLGKKVILACLLDRKNDYKDLGKYLSSLKNEMGL